MTTAEDVITPKERDELFLQFMNSFLTFLIYVCRCALIDCEEERVDWQQLENNLTNSLTLIWQMHVAIFTLKAYYKKIDYEHCTSLIFERGQSELVSVQLREMSNLVDCYPFIEGMNKLHCLSLLEQVQRYYDQCEYIIIDDDLYADPWLSNQHDSLNKC